MTTAIALQDAEIFDVDGTLVDVSAIQARLRDPAQLNGLLIATLAGVWAGTDHRGPIVSVRPGPSCRAADQVDTSWPRPCASGRAGQRDPVEVYRP